MIKGEIQRREVREGKMRSKMQQEKRKRTNMKRGRKRKEDRAD
jgi:hypothetical protein